MYRTVFNNPKVFSPLNGAICVIWIDGFFDHFPLDEGMSKTNIYNTTSSFYIVVYMLYNEITLYTIETAINVVSNADDL